MLKNQVERAHIPVQYINSAQGERLSEPLTHYSHIVVLGGAISAYEDAQYPYLKYEFELVEMALAARIPIVGICLGSQILAQVLGAKVYRGEAGREAGWCEIQLRDPARSDRLLQSFPRQFKVFQSHQDTFELPANCVHLAQSAQYPHQAFRYEDFGWAIQFHLEIDEHVLSTYSTIIEQELEDSQIQDTSVAAMIAAAQTFSPAVQPLADRFMAEFLQVPTG